jgi:hypothetical protein
MQVSDKKIFSITKVGSHDINVNLHKYHYCICNHTRVLKIIIFIRISTRSVICTLNSTQTLQSRILNKKRKSDGGEKMYVYKRPQNGQHR